MEILWKKRTFTSCIFLSQNMEFRFSYDELCIETHLINDFL